MRFRSIKGQASVEAILVIIFVILFLAVFNNLAQDAERLLKINMIKEQQNDIANSLNSFIKVQEGFVKGFDTDDYFNDFNFSYKIPNLKIPTENFECDINITRDRITLRTEIQEDFFVETIRTVNIDNSKINLINPVLKKCGSEIVCIQTPANIINCS